MPVQSCSSLKRANRGTLGQLREIPAARRDGSSGAAVHQGRFEDGGPGLPVLPVSDQGGGICQRMRRMPCRTSRGMLSRKRRLCRRRMHGRTANLRRDRGAGFRAATLPCGTAAELSTALVSASGSTHVAYRTTAGALAPSPVLWTRARGRCRPGCTSRRGSARLCPQCRRHVRVDDDDRPATRPGVKLRLGVVVVQLVVRVIWPAATGTRPDRSGREWVQHRPGMLGQPAEPAARVQRLTLDAEQRPRGTVPDRDNGGCEHDVLRTRRKRPRQLHIRRERHRLQPGTRTELHLHLPDRRAGYDRLHDLPSRRRQQPAVPSLAQVMPVTGMPGAANWDRRSRC